MPSIDIHLTQNELEEAVKLWLRQRGYAASDVYIFRNTGDRPGDVDSYGATGIGCTTVPKGNDGICFVCGDDPNGKRQPCAGKARGSQLKCPREVSKP